MEKLLTCQEVAQRYGVKTPTVWGWIRTGKLKACKIGRIYRVYPQDVEAFEKTTRSAKPAE